jgi:hypothetical protein
VARPQDWQPPAPDIVRCPLRYHAQLPRIVFWYAQGEALPAIERRLGTRHARTNPAHDAPSWGLDRAFATACARIAAGLNRRPRDYGL